MRKEILIITVAAFTLNGCGIYCCPPALFAGGRLFIPGGLPATYRRQRRSVRFSIIV